MIKKTIIANWKMNPASLKDAVKLAKAVDKKGVVLCIPFVFLTEAKKLLKKAALGAQDASTEEKGAYTGDVSATMLAGLGVKYVILGHSERRAMGETNSEINKKIKATLAVGLTPILCVGEKSRDENHEYVTVVREQLIECVQGINKNLVAKIIIAYEPVWALSTTANRKDATAYDALEMSIFIKKILSDKLGVNAILPKVVYGGSVNEKDVGDFLTNGGVYGALVGGASLDSKRFLQIITIAEKL